MLSKRRKVKRNRLQGGDLSVQDGKKMMAKKGMAEEESREESENSGPSK